MRDMATIDKNFKVETAINKPDIRFFNVRETPFAVYGVIFENGRFRRMPEDVAKAVSAEVHTLHAHTAGGRVRFCTDSPYVAIHVKMPDVQKHAHFPFTGSIGLDLYVKQDGEDVFVKTYVPPVDITDGYESVIEVGNGGMREYTLDMPLYSAVSELYVGLSDTAKVQAPTPYANGKPVVFYGSSITQGACASRAGNCYEAILSRRFNMDYINLGFSGSAKGEDPMIAYLASLDMSVFVCDYDYNAPNAAHLAATHEKLFKAVRAAHPTIPVIFMTKPEWYLGEENVKCLAVVRQTYENAKAAGDTNVYFLDNRALLAQCGNEGTVEGIHPNDYGFYSMAAALGGLLETLL